MLIIHLKNISSCQKMKQKLEIESHSMKKKMHVISRKKLVCHNYF